MVDSDDVKILSSEGTYSLFVGLIYAFNLMAGAGALAIPKAFQDAGYGLGLAILVVLGFLSYISVTFVLEAMSAANAKIKLSSFAPYQNSNLAPNSNCRKRLSYSNSTHTTDDDCASEKDRLLTPSEEEQLNAFEITERTELGQMSALFLNKYAVWFFYLSICLYLFGDLAIYGAMVPKSWTQVICTYMPVNLRNESCFLNFTMPMTVPCWRNYTISRLGVYRISVVAFGLFLGPFIFFSVSKTKYLQIFTTSTRWFSFGLMLTLALIQLSRYGPYANPAPVQMSSFGALFGASVYSFMCQHSLPSLITPVRSKAGMFTGMLFCYCFVFFVLASLSMTGIFTFPTVSDVYTLNFHQPYCRDAASVNKIEFFGYFLALFPVFTLSTNFPVLGITLRNNLRKAIYPVDADFSILDNPSKFPLSHSSPDSSDCDAPLSQNVPTINGVINNPGGQGTRPIRFESVHAPTIGGGYGSMNTYTPIPTQQEPNGNGANADAVPVVVDYVDTEPEPELIARVRRQWWVEKIFVPLGVVVLPLCIVLFTDNVEMLVSVTGCYAGAGIQYVMPALLAFAIRKHQNTPPRGFRSPFRSMAWVWLLFIWAAFTVVTVSVNLAMQHMQR